MPVRYKNVLALVASALFYTWGAPVFAIVLLVSGTLDFLVSKKLLETKAPKLYLIAGLTYNLATLFLFKYFNFFIENVRVISEQIGLGFPVYLELALPIGISFFTFQKISYLVDVYRKDTAPARNLVDYLLFVFLFPQLIAGPIVRYKELADQIVERFDSDSWTHRLSGFYRFIIGLGKKVLVADGLAPIADGAFSNADLSTGQAWIGLVAYTFQIYFDFSGYSDMAIGLGRMIGFRFPENFNWPYLSRGFQAFWSRWHMTLSNFMRDYLYIPLGGNRIGPSRTALNLWIVFLLSGLWHGASWTFVIWGAWHGLFLTIDRFTPLFRQTPKAIGFCLTFVLVALGWVWFRSESLSSAISFYSALFTWKGDFDSVISIKSMFLLTLAAGFSFAPINLHHKLLTLYWARNGAEDYLKLLGAVTILILCLGQLAMSHGQPFIYFRF